MAEHPQIIKIPTIEGNSNKVFEMYSGIIQNTMKKTRLQRLHVRNAFLRTINVVTGESVIVPVVIHQLFETSLLMDSIVNQTFKGEMKSTVVDRVPYFYYCKKPVDEITPFDFLEGDS